MGNLSYRFVIHGILLVLGLVISPGQSLTCTSQKFTNKVFPDCSDLPYLSAYLHWNYDSSNSTLSIAFVAPPPQTDGWVAWAINPTATGMAGSQALLAFTSNGSIKVNKYNISSYNFSSAGTNLSYEVSDLSAENSNGTIKIFATWKLPAKTEKVNQVWQVGPIAQGLPSKHEFNTENLNAKAVLQLVGASTPTGSPSPSPGPSISLSPSGSPSPSPSPSPAPSGTTNGNGSAPPPSGNDGGSSTLIRGTSSMIVGFFFILIGTFIVL